MDKNIKHNKKNLSSDVMVKRITVYALMLAIITLLTLFVSIPLPVGSGGAYLNAGDAAVYAGAYLLGGWGGALVAAVGSALADILHGSVLYAPATFLIKGAMALICGVLYARLSKRCRFLSAVIAGLVMPMGYFVYEICLFGSVVALYGLWTNAIQYLFGVVMGIIIIVSFEKVKFLSDIRNIK